MRASPLQRKTPLSRSPMRRKRARRIDRETPQETAYKAWSHEPGRPCYGDGLIVNHECEGPLEMAHIRDHTGASLKESWLDSVPLCKKLHDIYDGRRRGFEFSGWELEAKKTWMTAAIALANLEFFKGRA